MVLLQARPVGQERLEGTPVPQKRYELEAEVEYVELRLIVMLNQLQPF